MLTPVAVTPLPEYRLRVEYTDGVSGEVDLSHLVGKGVFAAWNDPKEFETVTIGDHGQLSWGNKIELCSDAIYLEVTSKSAEELFSSVKAPSV